MSLFSFCQLYGGQGLDLSPHLKILKVFNAHLWLDFLQDFLSVWIFQKHGNTQLTRKKLEPQELLLSELEMFEHNRVNFVQVLYLRCGLNNQVHKVCNFFFSVQ